MPVNPLSLVGISNCKIRILIFFRSTIAFPDDVFGALEGGIEANMGWGMVNDLVAKRRKKHKIV